MSKTILVLPNAAKFTRAQLKEMRDAGFLPVQVDEPERVRQLANEPVPLSGNQMLLHALVALRQQDQYTGYRVFLDGLIQSLKQCSGLGECDGQL